MTTLNLIGKTVGRFEILSQLGRGGMGFVYQARQTDLDRIVALKILPPHFNNDTSYIARFHQEAKSAARLEHPNIVTVYDFGNIVYRESEQTDPLTLHYIAMKYISGDTLKQRLKKHGTMSLGDALDIVTRVGKALDYAHQKDILHRDVKPSNIMIAEDGHIYLADFGTARDIRSADDLTLAGTIIGTPEYMSPEQAQGFVEIGPPADVYALGIVFYEMLTGEFPFQADTPMAIMAARLLESPRSLRDIRRDLPSFIDDIVMTALARQPSERFQHVSAMITALNHAFEGGRFEEGTPTLIVESPNATHVLPTQQTVSGRQTQHTSTASDPQYSYSQSGTPPQTKSGNSVWAIFRSPIGLLTAFLLIFVLIAGWFRISSTFFNPKPTPMPTPIITPFVETPVVPTLPSLDQEALIMEGWEYLNNGQFDEAQESFDSLLQTNVMEPEAYNGLGWVDREEGRYKESIEQFEAAIGIDENHVGAHNGLGWSLYDLGEYDKAEEHFLQATALDPKYANAFYGLGLVQEELGRYDAAKKSLQKSLDLEPDNEDVENALARVKMK